MTMSNDNVERQCCQKAREKYAGVASDHSDIKLQMAMQMAIANGKCKLMTQGIKPMTGEEDTCQM